MKKQIMNVIPLSLKSTTVKFFKLLLNLGEKIQNFLLNFSSKTLNHQEEEKEENSRKIGESTINPRPTPPPSPIRVRKAGVATINPRPKKVQNPRR